MEVFLDNSPSSFLVEVFAHYTNLVHRKKVNLIRLSEAAQQYIQQGILQIPIVPCLITPGEIITNPISICNYFSEISYTSEIMIGENNDVQFLSIYDLCRRFCKNRDDLLAVIYLKRNYLNIKSLQQKHFNYDLELKVFLVGHHISLADLILFAFTYSIVTCLDDAGKWKYNNIFRWYNNVQNLDGMKQFLQNTSRSFSTYPEPLIEHEGDKAKGKANKKK